MRLPRGGGEYERQTKSGSMRLFRFCRGEEQRARYTTPQSLAARGRPAAPTRGDAQRDPPRRYRAIAQRLSRCHFRRSEPSAPAREQVFGGRGLRGCRDNRSRAAAAEHDDLGPLLVLLDDIVVAVEQTRD